MNFMDYDEDLFCSDVDNGEIINHLVCPYLIITIK
jgi:hypothetical protein